MIKEVKYNGITTRPSDYDSPDGNLAVSLNLVNEDGGLHPLPAPKELVGFGDYQPKYIHKTAYFTHYIVVDHQTYKWVDSTELETMNNLYSFPRSVFPVSVTSSGNTLIILTNKGMYYFLWKDNDYQVLGSHLPELQLSFGLKGTTYYEAQFEIDLGQYGIQSNAIPYTEGGKYYFPDEATGLNNIITSKVLSRVNKFVGEHSGDKFIFPFFVRYAFRLYDGTLSMHSSPVLMVTNSSATPRAFIQSIFLDPEDSGLVKKIYARIGGIDYDLDCQFVDNSGHTIETALENWSDIIKSVDIFVSAPLFSYNQAGQVRGIANNTPTQQGFAVAKINSGSYYTITNTAPLIVPDYGTGIHGKMEFILPEFDNEENANVCSAANFYLLKSLSLGDVFDMSSRTTINIPENYLKTLLQYEQMTDDYDSHDTQIPQYAFPYNNRLNIANLTKRLADSHTLSYYSTYVNAVALSTECTRYNVYVFIKQGGKEYVVSSESDFASLELGKLYPLIFFYYPNPNAYKVVLVNASDTTERYEFKLERHDFLNGAYFFNGWTSSVINPDARTPGMPTASADLSVPLPNKIYTSEVENPFFFPVTGINTIGTGSIIALSTTAKALSQGQFGQFPLYAFTTDGIWALEVSSTGTYSAKQPISREVCINADSVTQLDSSVLFASDRGIMLVSGSSVSCLSDNIEAQMLDFTDLPKYQQILTAASMSASDVYYKNFLTFVKNCRMVYDYTHQRIIIFNPTLALDGNNFEYSYAYVYSLKSNLWGMMESNFVSTLNSYPDTLAVAANNKLVTFSDTDSVYTSCLLTTRPFKLDNPNVLKSVHSVIQRGLFQQGDVKTVLYGSRDLYSWHLIGSSTSHKLRHFCGSPYKYFRLVAIASLSAGKSLSGFSVDFTPRHTNNLY